MTMTLNIPRIDCSTDDAREAVQRLRRQLSPRGDVVSPEGRARTIAAFGEPLTPQQVVERICADVQCRGLDAVLEYTARLDGKTLAPGEVRVGRDELADGPRGGRSRPTCAPSAGSATTSSRSSRASSTATPHFRRGHGMRAGPALSPPASRRRLHPGRGGGLSVVAPDDGRARAGGGRRADRRGRAADEVRRLQRRPARGLPRAGRDRGPPRRRCPGGGGAGLRRRGHRGRRQDRRAGQPVRRAGEEAGLRRGRHRQHRRAERGRRHRRLDGRPALRRGRPDLAGRALPGREHPDHLGTRPHRPRGRRPGRRRSRPSAGATSRATASNASAP